MSHRSEVEVFALRAAREYATARGLKLVAAFEDTLSGDVARMQVLRRVRRSFPKVVLATRPSRCHATAR